MRVLWYGYWLIAGLVYPSLLVVSFGFEIGGRTDDQIPHWAILPGIAVVLLVGVGLILSNFMLMTSRAWAVGTYAGSFIAVVVAMFADDRWYILGALLAVPVYTFTHGVVDGRFRQRAMYALADLAYPAREDQQGDHG